MPICFVVRLALRLYLNGRADKLIKSGLRLSVSTSSPVMFFSWSRGKRLSHYAWDKLTLSTLIFSSHAEFNVRDIIGANEANMRLVAYLSPIWLHKIWMRELKTRIYSAAQRDHQLIVSVLHSVSALANLVFDFLTNARHLSILCVGLVFGFTNGDGRFDYERRALIWRSCE